MPVVGRGVERSLSEKELKAQKSKKCEAADEKIEDAQVRKGQYGGGNDGP